MMTIHIKVWREHFEKIISGKKKQELQLAEKLRLSQLIFSKPKTKLLSRPKKLENTAFKLYI